MFTSTPLPGRPESHVESFRARPAGDAFDRVFIYLEP
jgi:hypothetical protein